MDGPDRRTVLKGVAGAGPLVALARHAAARDVSDDATTVPEEARTVEAGLELFVAKWEAAGPVITTGQFGRYLSGKTFNLYVAEAGQTGDGTDRDPRAYSLQLGQDGGAVLTSGPDPAPHVELTVDRADWLDILYGEYSGIAPAVAGRTFAPKSQVNAGAVLAIVLYILAQIPISLVHDLDSNAETMQGIVERRGATDCGSDVGHSKSPEAVVADRTRRTAAGPANRAPDVVEPLATWVDNLSYGDLPGEVVGAAKHQLKSILGVTFGASAMPPAGRFLDGVAALDPGPPPREATDALHPATVLAGEETFRASPANAAMANAYLAQMLEWEDWTYMAHTGSAIVPTALAAAQAAIADPDAPDPTGEDLITAVVAGNEIAGRTGTFLTDPTNLGQSLPVHQTELPFVAGKLLGLGPGGLADASGIAGTQPQMTTIPTWPSDSKGLVGGEPAGTSVRAAQLAGAGMHGSRDHLENVGGYWYRVSDIWDPQRLALVHEGLDPDDPAGSQFRMQVAATEPDVRPHGEFFDKRYPCDGFTQTAVHGVLLLRNERGVSPDRVEEVNVRMNTAMAATGTLFNAGQFEYIPEKILNADEPDWTYTALLFDGIYPLVAGLIAGELTHRQYEREFIEDNLGAIEALYRAVELTTDVSVDQFGAEVRIVTDDGPAESLRGAVDAVAGRTEHEQFVGCITDMDHVYDRGQRRPFGPGTKLEIAASDVLPAARIRAIDRAVDTLDDEGGLRNLIAALDGDATSGGRPAGR